MLNSSRDKNEGTCPSGEGGGGPVMWTRPLSYYWKGAREQCEDDNRDEEKKEKKLLPNKTWYNTSQAPHC